MSFAEFVLRYDLILSLCVLQRPVQIVALNLDELEHAFVLVQDVLEKFRAAVEGESEVPYLSLFLELEDVGDYVILLALIDLYRPLVDVVQQVEVEVVGAASAEGDVEQGGVVHRTGERVPRELVREVVAVSGILAERFGYCCLRLASQIRVGGVEVVHAAFDRKIEHGVDLLLVDLAGGGIGGESHASEAEPGQSETVEIIVDHDGSSLYKRVMTGDSLSHLFSFLCRSIPLPVK